MNTVWMESTTSTAGRAAAAVVSTVSRLVSLSSVDVARVFAQTIGAQLDLERALLARRVERRVSGALQPRGHLQQQRRLADARLAADEDHRARDDPAAEHEVELVDARRSSAVPRCR